MNKKQCEDIYWVLTGKVNFTLNYPDEKDYGRIKKERVKIANRYMELKFDHDFLQSDRIANHRMVIRV